MLTHWDWWLQNRPKTPEPPPQEEEGAWEPDPELPVDEEE